MPKTRKVIHDKKHCIGCNSCVSIAPQSWKMDSKEGKACLIGAQQKGKVQVGEIFECDADANRMAADACPMNIIKVMPEKK